MFLGGFQDFLPAFLHDFFGTLTLTLFEDLGLSQNLMRAIRHPGRAFSEHCLTVEQDRGHGGMVRILSVDCQIL